MEPRLSDMDRKQSQFCQKPQGQGCARSYGESSRMSKMLKTDRGCGGRVTGGASVEIQGEQGLDFSERVSPFQRALPLVPNALTTLAFCFLLQPPCSPSRCAHLGGRDLGFTPLSGHGWQNGFHGPFINHPCSWRGSSLPAHWSTLLVVSICCFQTEVSTFQQLCLILTCFKEE